MRRLIAVAAIVSSMALPSGVALGAKTPSPSTTHAEQPIYGLASGSDYAVVDAGSQAPDFAFESVSGSMRLRDLRRQGHVLLLIGPGDPQMLELERARESLLSMSVVPVVVLDRRPGACRAIASRLGLGYPVISDQRRIIGAQYNALDPSSRADAPAWFVIEQRGRVRALDHMSWPGRPWTEVCAEALGLPMPDAPRPAAVPR